MIRPAWAVLPLVLLFGACSYAVHPVEQPHVQLIAESYGPAEIRAALIRAMERRKFTAEKEEEGRITAHFQKSDRSLRVVVEYTPTQFGVRYVDSAGFGEAKDPTTGAAVVDTRYDDMVRTLEKVIVEELRRPAKEAAAAERHRQEYEAMLQMSRQAGGPGPGRGGEQRRRTPRRATPRRPRPARTPPRRTRTPPRRRQTHRRPRSSTRPSSRTTCRTTAGTWSSTTTASSPSRSATRPSRPYGRARASRRSTLAWPTAATAPASARSAAAADPVTEGGAAGRRIG